MSAYARLAAVSALAVSFVSVALPASAADLYAPPYDGYGEGPPPPRYERYDRYADGPDDFEPPYPQRYAERGCTPRELARDRLRDAGWFDFHGLEAREDVVLVKARAPSGRLFDLTIDRCSGQIVDARPLRRRGPGPYAYGPRRHWAPY